MVMLLILISVLFTGVVDMMVHVVPHSHRRLRSGLAWTTCVLFGVATVIIVSYRLNLFTLAMTVLFIYRTINMARIIKGRMHDLYLWHVTFKTSMWLALAQLMLFAVLALWDRNSPQMSSVLGAILGVQILFASLCINSALGHRKKTRQVAAYTAMKSSELPSITVAIPARNETSELYDCTQSLLQVDYPKLEILVLDDCSQTRRTPEIIRSFAHEGVRFINGEEPSESWLAKNQAYEHLARSANGEYIIFAGVDIRFDAGSLRRLVSYALTQHKSMVCVMPHNTLRGHGVPIIQPMRYTWEVALPRKLVNKPPALSSCWLISKQALKHAGGFQAAARMVVPEAYFARQTLAQNGYSFIAAGETIGIASIKGLPAQRDTAIRVAYPSVHRRPEKVALFTSAYLLWVSVPLLAIVHALIVQTIDLTCITALILLSLQSTVYAIVFRLAYGRAPFLAVLSFPFAALVYVGLLNYSMYKYEFSEVIWKGRNVCLPVMHVVPHLPKA